MFVHCAAAPELFLLCNPYWCVSVFHIEGTSMCPPCTVPSRLFCTAYMLVVVKFVVVVAAFMAGVLLT
jgi:hypothetical protein